MRGRPMQRRGERGLNGAGLPKLWGVLADFNESGSRMSRTVIVGLVALATILLAPQPSASSQVAEECRVPVGVLAPGDLPSGASVLSCGVVGREIVSGGMGVKVPAPGSASFISAQFVDGTSRTFGIRVGEDGKVSYPSQTTPLLAAAASPTSCDDDTYGLLGFKEYGTWNWYIGDGGKPAGLSVSGAQSAYADAINNMTQTTNTCNYSDQVDASAAYQGTTTVESDISSTGTCTDPDSRSSIDAGNLPASWIAATCAFTRGIPGFKDDLVQADIRFNTTDHDFSDGGCTTQFDVRATLTHEVGHVFGLNDIYGAHEWLTMFGNGGPCETRARTLAKGDVLGMRSLY